MDLSVCRVDIQQNCHSRLAVDVGAYLELQRERPVKQDM